MPHVGGRGKRGRRGMKQRRGQRRRRTPFKQGGVTARRKGGKVRRRRATGGRAMSGINGNTPQRKRSHRRRRTIRKPTRGRNPKVGRPGMGPWSAQNYQVGGLTGGHWCYYGTRTPWTGKVLTHNGVSYGVGSDGVMAGDSPRLGSCDGNT